MTIAQSGTIVRSAQDVVLNGGARHPALTPRMRRLAAEYWAIAQAKAVAEGFPIVSAELDADTDLEGVDWARIVVQCDAPAAPTFAFQDAIKPNHAEWVAQLGSADQEAVERLMLNLHWIPAARIDGVV